MLSDKSTYLPRGDYKELIQITLIILGVPIPDYKLHILGGLHNARWMCKIIYAFKYYLLRAQMQFEYEFLKSLEDFCIFCTLLYVRQWLTCPSLPDAALNDLSFCKNLHNYKKINTLVAESAIAKLNDHLWYMGAELASFNLFSDRVTEIEKRSVICKMKKCDANWKRIQRPKFKDTHLKNIDDLVTSRSLVAIDAVSSPVLEFMLNNDPTIWKTNSDFNQV